MELRILAALREPLVFSAYLRRGLFLYVTALIAALQATSVLELAVNVTVTVRVAVFVLAALIPLPVALVGVLLWPPRETQMRVKHWGLNAAAVFAFWAGGYFLVGALSYSGRFESLEIPLDNVVPFVPEWVFVYLTVYPFFMLPLLYVEDTRRLLVLDIAQVLALLVSYLTFVVFPVAIVRPAVVPHDLATHALAIVQGRDPPWNCFPSTHCTACTVAALALLDENRWLGVWGLVSTAAICVSTVMTRQHFVLDAVTGVLLGGGLYFLVRFALLDRRVGDRLSRLIGPFAGPLMR
jgi:hypothetical protein